MAKKKNAFRKWLDKSPRGTMSSLATSMNVSRQYVYKIAEGDQILSHKKAKELSKLTGLKLKEISHYKVTVHVA